MEGGGCVWRGEGESPAGDGRESAGRPGTHAFSQTLAVQLAARPLLVVLSFLCQLLFSEQRHRWALLDG